MTAAVAVGVLVAGGVYLVLQRGLLRVVLGFVLLGHAVNVLVLSAGGMARRDLPLLGRTDPAAAADPLPQAFVLTAIVITFGITVYLLALVRADDAGEDEEPDVSGHDAAQHTSAPDDSGQDASGTAPADRTGQVR